MVMGREFPNTQISIHALQDATNNFKNTFLPLWTELLPQSSSSGSVQSANTTGKANKDSRVHAQGSSLQSTGNNSNVVTVANARRQSEVSKNNSNYKGKVQKWREENMTIQVRKSLKNEVTFSSPSIDSSSQSFPHQVPSKNTSELNTEAKNLLEATSQAKKSQYSHEIPVSIPQKDLSHKLKKIMESKKEVLKEIEKGKSFKKFRKAIIKLTKILKEWRSKLRIADQNSHKRSREIKQGWAVLQRNTSCDQLLGELIKMADHSGDCNMFDLCYQKLMSAYLKQFYEAKKKRITHKSLSIP